MADLTKVEFTPPEKGLVDEAFAAYIQVVTFIARLHGIKPQEMPMVRVSDDRTGLMLPVKEG